MKKIPIDRNIMVMLLTWIKAGKIDGSELLALSEQVTEKIDVSMLSDAQLEVLATIAKCHFEKEKSQ